MPRYDESIRYDEGLAYGRWQPPARSAADVWQGFPAWWTEPDDPARDGMGAGLVSVFNAVASTAARMSRMHLRAHAKGWALDLVARAAGLARADGEADWQLRARLAEVEDVVSPTAVASAVHALLPEAIVVRPARHTFFVGRSFIGRPPVDYVATRLAGDGRSRFATDAYGRAVGTARVWSSYFGRFHVVLPSYAGALARPAGVGRFFVNRRGGYATARAVVARQLAQTLDRVRAAGIRWTAFADLVR